MYRSPSDKTLKTYFLASDFFKNDLKSIKELLNSVSFNKEACLIQEKQKELFNSIFTVRITAEVVLFGDLQRFCQKIFLTFYLFISKQVHIS